MSTEITGQVGSQSLTDGNQGMAFRQGRTGEMVVSELQGRYHENASRGKLFYSTCVATATSQVSTSAIGNILWNPPGSGVNLSLIFVSSHISVTTAALTGIVIAQSVQTAVPGTTTAATRTGPTLIGIAGSAQSGQVVAYSIATLTTAPTAFHYLQQQTVAIATTGENMQDQFLDGMYVFPPGNVVCIATVGAAAAASGHNSTFVWAETPA